MRRIAYILILLNCFNFLSGQKVESKRRATDTISVSTFLRDYHRIVGCDSILKEAENNFKEGMYLKCIDDLNAIWKSCTFTKKKREKVLELFAKAYLEVGKTEEADQTVNRMLHNNPHYELREGENPEDFNRLVKKYKIHPLITIGVRNTADWVNYKTSKVYKVLDGLDYTEPYSKYKYGLLQGFGFMYYGTAEIEFDKHFSLNGDLTFWWIRYFPVGNNILPYVTIGVGWNYMTRASGNVTISYTKDDVVTGKNIDFDAATYEMDMLEMRNRNTFEWIAGAGIGYKFKNLRLFLDARYYGGLNSFTDPKKGLENITLVNDYYYVDNSVHLTQFEVGVSICYTLFNSVKKKK